MRPLVLTRQKGGINRQQVVGSPPNSTLYDLLNGYLYNGERYVARPGSRALYSVPGTKGLITYQGGLMVFSHEPTAVPSGVTCAVLPHPEDNTLTIESIRFAAPFLGYPYVVARFDNGNVYHYWLQPVEAWEANTVYCEGDLVRPSTDNGYSYQAIRLSEPFPIWKAGEERNVGDKREPSTPNCYYYEVTAIQEGDAGTPTTGDGTGPITANVSPDNAGFESGNTGWTEDPGNVGSFTITEDAAKARTGSWLAIYTGDLGTVSTQNDRFINDRVVSVVNGGSAFTFTAYFAPEGTIPTGAAVVCRAYVEFLDEDGVVLNTVLSNAILVTDTTTTNYRIVAGYSASSGPPGVASMRGGLQVNVSPANTGVGAFSLRVDDFAWSVQEVV